MTIRRFSRKIHTFRGSRRPAWKFWSEKQKVPHGDVVTHIPWEDLTEEDFPTLDALRRFMRTGKRAVP